MEDMDTAAEHGKVLSEFLKANDIEKWSNAFLDPSWTHDVIRETGKVSCSSLTSRRLYALCSNHFYQEGTSNVKSMSHLIPHQEGKHSYNALQIETRKNKVA